MRNRLRASVQYTQVEHNRESTARQYELAERAARLGWRRDQVKVIDEDLGIPVPAFPSAPASRV